MGFIWHVYKVCVCVLRYNTQSVSKKYEFQFDEVTLEMLDSYDQSCFGKLLLENVK